MSLLASAQRSISSDEVALNNLLTVDEDIIHLDPDTQIELDPDQPRRLPKNYTSSEEHKEMVASVKQAGIIAPVTVRPHRFNPDGTVKLYKLVVGEKRVRACSAAKRPVPAIVRALTDMEALQLQIIENEQRSDVSDVDRARAYKRYKDMLKKSSPRVTWEDVAKEFGMTEAHMKRLQALLSLPDDIQEDVRDGNLSTRQARGLTLIKGNPDAQRELATEAKTYKLSGDEVEAKARAQKEVTRLSQTKVHQQQINTKTEIPYTAPRNYVSDLKQFTTGFEIVVAAMEKDKPGRKDRKEIAAYLQQLLSQLERAELALAD